MRTLISPILALLLLTSSLVAQDKKRVAVLDFDYATVSNAVASLFGTNTDVGRGVADMLVNKLVEGGVYSVIERKALDAVLAEQDFSNSDRVNPASAAKIGKILGVDAMIIGSITQFGRDDKSTGVGGFGSVTGRFGIGGIGKKKSKAVVALSARMINIDTAEILAVANGKGESTRSGTTLLGAGGGAPAVAGAGYDMTSSNFASTILGEATTEAVADVAKTFDQKAASLPRTTREVEGLVADATEGVLILNVGTNAGVRVGDVLEVRRQVREVKDPATGRVLRRITNKVGEVTITEADEVSSIGNFSGASPAQVGDTVKTP